jgi:glycosyltransferase involved in cell wall biosynthesis
MGRSRLVGSVREIVRGARARRARLRELEQRVALLETEPHHADAVLPVMAWIDQVRLEREPLISVVTPTHDRAALLERAIDSVVAQSYANWELIAVDDASSDGTPELLQAPRDPRVRALRVQRHNCAAARNAALDAAEGELIAYLDDDNVMHPNWLKSVAWAFAQRPDRDLLYGGFVVEDFLELIRKGGGSWPALALNGFDQATIVERAPTDISTIAHRAGLAGARFDESQPRLSDWDLLARLTADCEPLVLPVIACFYYTSTEDRMSGEPAAEAQTERVRSRARAVRGL